MLVCADDRGQSGTGQRLDHNEGMWLAKMIAFGAGGYRWPNSSSPGDTSALGSAGQVPPDSMS
jgi:hypothetical protein